MQGLPRLLKKKKRRKAHLKVADEACMPFVVFAIPLVTSELHILGIDYHNLVTGLEFSGVVGGFVLSLE